MQTKIILTIVIILFVAGAGWLLISPAFKKVELNEPSPLSADLKMNTPQDQENQKMPAKPLLINDELDKMDTKTSADFNKQVESMKNKVIEKTETMPAKASVVSKGIFIPRIHDVKGQALLIKTDAADILRFENFETIDGPDLHVYLSSALSSADYVDLGLVKATKGNVNYDVPAGTDIKKYSNVLIWCKPFGVLFSYAELK